MARNTPKGQRQQRISQEVQRCLADLISREVKDPRVGPVTVTEVRVASDLSVAQVYIVPFGGARPAEGMLVGLGNAAGFLRGEVGRRVGLRHAPRLEFHLDESFDRAAHLSSLITEAVRSDGERSTSAGQEAGD
ncbi:MAG: ribosome-binding factor [Pseudomonadota bacterium]